MPHRQIDRAKIAGAIAGRGHYWVRPAFRARPEWLWRLVSGPELF
jgi:hypothetical protein